MERLTYRRDIDDAVCIKDMRPHNAPMKVQEVAERLASCEGILFDAYGKERITVEHLTELVKEEQKQREGRGYWEEIRGSDQFCVHYYACSKCHNAALRDDIGMQVLSNLCPHCGRDLRGESHDGT